MMTKKSIYRVALISAVCLLAALLSSCSGNSLSGTYWYCDNFSTYDCDYHKMWIHFRQSNSYEFIACENAEDPSTWKGGSGPYTLNFNAISISFAPSFDHPSEEGETLTGNVAGKIMTLKGKKGEFRFDKTDREHYFRN